MGQYCPKCQLRKPVVRNITLTGKGAITSDEVLAQELSCGHIVGGEEYTKFQAAVETMQADANAAIDKIKADTRAKIQAAARGVLVKEDA